MPLKHKTGSVGVRILSWPCPHCSTFCILPPCIWFWYYNPLQFALWSVPSSSLCRKCGHSPSSRLLEVLHHRNRFDRVSHQDLHKHLFVYDLQDPVLQRSICMQYTQRLTWKANIYERRHVLYALPKAKWVSQLFDNLPLTKLASIWP